MSTDAGGVSVPASTANDIAVRLFVAAQGNHCMVEIAELFREGFQQIGISSEIAFDEIPDSENKQTFPIVVAPHEYIPLCLQQTLGPEECDRVMRQCYVITTEQPGSSWFHSSSCAAHNARGVFDISKQGTDAFQKLGLAATHTPLGLGQPFLEHSEQTDPDNDIDVVFLGHSSPRRDRFFAKHANLFHRLNCRLVMAPVDQPRTEGSSMIQTGARRNALLRSSRILINIHSYERRYFEWHRALSAIANRCLLISETSESTDPLVPGKHFASGSIDELATLVEYYLQNEDERTLMTDAAYEHVRTEIPVSHACQQMVRRFEADSNQSNRPTPQTHPMIPAPETPVEETRTPIASAGLFSRFASGISNRVQLRRRRASTSQRRAAMVRNLETVERLRAADPDSDVTFIDNALYDTARPAVSVVVTLYNYAEYISDCLTSVAASQHDAIPGGFEILVVDDTSTDSSADVASQFVNECTQPMRLVRKKVNTGVADARNVGIHLARGEYVFILDADNLVLPNGIEMLYSAITDVPNPAAYGIIAQFEHSTGEPKSLVSNYAWNVKHLVHTPYIDAMALFHRQKLLDLGGYSPELLKQGWQGLEDYDLWLRIAADKNECTFVPNLVARYRMHSRSMLADTTLYREQLCTLLNSRHVEFLREVHGFDGPFGLPPRPAWILQCRKYLGLADGESWKTLFTRNVE